MQTKQFEIWLADLNPQIGTEAGKVRPVLVVQSDLLNKQNHPSTIICPITTSVQENSEILRVHISKGTSNILSNSDIMIDQIRAIDNSRFIKRIGLLPDNQINKVRENLCLILDIE
jgi:mRNA interferase MazF